jgi:hypothetical protein
MDQLGAVVPYSHKKMEAVSGFEPEKNGVANRCLKHSATPPLNPIYLKTWKLIQSNFQDEKNGIDRPDFPVRLFLSGVGKPRLSVR